MRSVACCAPLLITLHLCMPTCYKSVRAALMAARRAGVGVLWRMSFGHSTLKPNRYELRSRRRDSSPGLPDQPRTLLLLRRAMESASLFKTASAVTLFFCWKMQQDVWKKSGLNVRSSSRPCLAAMQSGQTGRNCQHAQQQSDLRPTTTCRAGLHLHEYRRGQGDMQCRSE